MFDTVLFDLDGTITDPFEGISNSVVYALGKFGIEVADRNELKCFIGPPLYESFMTRYGFDKPAALKAIDCYREYYADRGIFECYLYDGIEETLSELHRRKKTVMLATSKPEIFAKKLLERFNLTCYFDYIAGATLDSSLVDKDKIIALALKRSGCDRSRAIMVGDRKHDIYGAKQNGIKCVGATYGYGGISELTAAGADFIIDRPTALLKIVDND